MLQSANLLLLGGGRRGISSTLLLSELDSLRLLGIRHEHPAAFPIVEAFNLALHPVTTPGQLTPDLIASSRGAFASATGAMPATATASHLGVTVTCASGCHLAFVANGGPHVWWTASLR
jgi:hypothetical protein